MWTADDVGEAIVLLALVFLAAALIRKWSRHLRVLFVPTAVIGGFLALALGPEGVGRLADSNGIFPARTFEVWRALPAAPHRHDPDVRPRARLAHLEDLALRPEGVADEHGRRQRDRVPGEVAAAFSLVSGTVSPVTTASVKVLLTSGLPNEVRFVCSSLTWIWFV